MTFRFRMWIRCRRLTPRAAVIVTPGTITYLLSIPWLVMQTLPPEKHRWLVTLCAEEPGNIRA